MKYLEVGKIVSTHGIKGEVKVISDSSFILERFKVGNILYINNNNTYLPIKINTHRTHKNYQLITFNDYQNINDVLKYVGSFIYVDKESLSLLEDGEYYYDDLIGLDVYTIQSELIGKVDDIMEVPQGEILIIKRKDLKDALVPFVKEYIKEVDLKEKRIIISPIEGLL